MRIFRSNARKTRRATGDDTGVYRPSEPQADEAEGGKDHPVERGFLWSPQGKASERREGILRYVGQARRRLDEAGTQKDGSESGDDGWEAPPVPIPNTAVKLPRVESTGLEAAWEDRLLPVT